MIPKLITIKNAPIGIKYLPVGVHKTTLEEIESYYSYNIFRKEIFRGLVKLIDDLKTIGCNCVYVNGSFVTSILKPGDVDVCWVECSGTQYLYEKLHLPIIFNRSEAKKVYKADVFPADGVADRFGRTYFDFFQLIKYTDIKKGILQLDIY